ncbi:TPA: hypothetical protein PWK76_000506 [Escherichia coli]|nr:hypothetical protein [Escherichia coli]
MAGELPETNQSHEIAWPMPVLFEIFIIACGAIMKGLFIPDVTELGASSDSFPSGIVIPGANVMTLPPGEWVDLSDIDLTSSALDYRVSFSCASNHAYYSADGTIQFAAPDVWPLEYRNGVAVGRHEPEPQRTNYSTSGAIAPSNFSGTGKINGSVSRGGIELFDVTLDTGAGRDRFIAYMTSALIGNGYITASFYTSMGGTGNPTSISSNRVIVHGNTGNYLDRRSVLDLTTMTVKPFAGQEGYIDSVRAIQTGGLVRNVMTLQTKSPVMRTDVRIMMTPNNDPAERDLSGLVGCVQLEQGKFATSPVITAGTAAARAGGFGFIKNPGGLATFVRILYSDNATLDIECPLDGSDIPIPQSKSDWGKRYIQRIEYIR